MGIFERIRDAIRILIVSTLEPPNGVIIIRADKLILKL